MNKLILLYYNFELNEGGLSRVNNTQDSIQCLDEFQRYSIVEGLYVIMYLHIYIHILVAFGDMRDLKDIYETYKTSWFLSVKES